MPLVRDAGSGPTISKGRLNNETLVNHVLRLFPSHEQRRNADRRENTPGPVDLSKLADHFKDIKGEAAFYQSKREADNWAKVYGWTANDGNHRCPDCVVVEMETPYAGIIEKHGATSTEGGGMNRETPSISSSFFQGFIER